MQLYFAAGEITIAETKRSAGVVRSRSPHRTAVSHAQSPSHEPMSTREPYSPSLRQGTEGPSHSAGPVDSDDEFKAAAKPAERAAAMVTSTSTDMVASTPIMTAGIGGEEPREAEPASETVSRAQYAYHPKPEYPERAIREGWEGTVLLEVLIDSHGRPERVSINRSSGFAVLDQAAREAVKNWRFRPASLGNRQITSRERVPIVFRLDVKN